MTRGPWLIAVLAVLAGALGGPLTASAFAGFDMHFDVGRNGDRYVVRGPVDLKAGEVARSIVVGHGPVTIRRGAVVTDDLVVADGPLEISGTVRGRVITLGDRAVVTRTAVIGDGIRWASDKPVVAPGARVSGGIQQLDWSTSNPLVPAAAWWLAMTISTLVLGLLLLLLVPRAAESIAALMRDGGWGPALGVGFVLLIGLPLLALFALVTVVGIPFAIGLALALVPLAAVGYVTGAWVLGRRMVGPPPDRRFRAFLAGWAVLRVAALVPVLGALVFLVTALFGVGALAWALLQARREGGATGGPEAPLAPAI